MSSSCLKGFFKSNPHLTKPDRKLFEGVAEGDASRIKAAIVAGANVNARITDGYIREKTALMLACQNPNPECVSALLASGADVNAKTRSESRGAGDMTALLYATQSMRASTSKHEIVELLLNHGAKANVRNNAGDSPLSQATGEGAIKAVNALLCAGADKEDERALRVAAAQNDKPIFEKLLSFGYPKETLGRCLLSACRRGAEEMVEFLLQKGADPKTVAQGGENAATYIAVYARNDCSQPADYEKAHRIARCLVENGTEINLIDKDGLAPLDYALEASDSRLAQYIQSVGGKRASDL